MSLAENTEANQNQLPQPTLTALIQMLYLQGMMAASGQSPEGKPTEFGIDIARLQFQIELLEMLKEKTDSNRDKEEEAAMSYSLDQLRRAYLQIKS